MEIGKTWGVVGSDLSVLEASAMATTETCVCDGADGDQDSLTRFKCNVGPRPDPTGTDEDWGEGYDFLAEALEEVLDQECPEFKLMKEATVAPVAGDDAADVAEEDVDEDIFGDPSDDEVGSADPPPGDLAAGLPFSVAWCDALDVLKHHRTLETTLEKLQLRITDSRHVQDSISMLNENHRSCKCKCMDHRNRSWNRILIQYQ